MTNYKKKLIIGSRASQLAMAQTNDFIDKVLKAYPDMEREAIEVKTIKTSGDLNQTSRLDQMGGKGLFAKEIEKEILEGKIDIGIHSMKDMPTIENEELMIGCWLKREDHRDCLLSNSSLSLADLRSKTVVGTSSIRRRSQILNLRNDLCIKSLRGNVDTRIKKLNDNFFDAIVLSAAGLQRLSLMHLIRYTFDEDEILPAACQGAVGIQMLSSNEDLKLYLDIINHTQTETECRTERSVLKQIKANCNSPIGLLATIENDQMILRCDIFNHNGEKIFTACLEDHIAQSEKLGQVMSNNILLSLGQEIIDNLDVLKNDFDYTPS